MTQQSGLPARPAWYVGRAGISASLDRGGWLTTVVAGTGAGKTTALGGWAANQTAAWLSLRDGDADLSAFVTRLVAATRDAGMGELLPVAAPDAVARTADVSDADDARADALASLLASAVDQSAAAGPVVDHVIVLDRFDHMTPGSGAARFVESLCRHAPRGLRLVVASRGALPFAVQRLRDTGRLTELTGDLLAFGVDETYLLLTIALGDAASADELAGDLHTLTAGWPGQVSLGAAWLAQQPPATRRARLARFGGFDRELAESVLANATAPAREVVRAAAYLPRVDERLIRAVGLAAGPDVSSLLSSAAPMLMPESGRPGWFRVSATTRAAVHAKNPLVPARRHDLMAGAARWYAAHGELDSAVTTAVELRNPEVLTGILDEYGAELIMGGRAADVITAIDTIPAAARSRAVLLVESEARHGRGDVAGSLRCLGEIDAGGAQLSAAVARRIGKIRQLAGDIAGALEVYDRTARDGTQPVDEAILVGQIATVHWLRGDIERARTIVAEAITMSEQCGDRSALAGAYATAAMIAERDGDFVANDEYTERAAAAARASGDLVQLIRIRVNRSQRLIQQGLFADALVELEDAMRLTEMTGTGGWFGSVARTNRGWAYRGLGRFDEALAEFDTAREYWRDAHSDLVAYAQIGLGATYLDRGDIEAADVELSAAMEIGQRSGDHQSMTGLVTLARTRYATDREAAWQIIERALGTVPGHWRSWALLSVGWMALCDGDRDTAVAQVQAVRENTVRFPDPCAIAETDELAALAMTDHEQAIVLLGDAQRQWARIGNPVFVHRTAVALAHRARSGVTAAESRLRAIGVRPAAATSAGPLRVVGAFRNSARDVDQAKFVAAAHDAIVRFDRAGDSDGARRALTDALALLAGAPVEQGGELRALYVAVLAALARACELSGDIDGALGWRLRVLEGDPYDEGGHLGVVTTLARAGRHAEARRRYRLYTDRMRHTGREPAPYPSDLDLRYR